MPELGEVVSGVLAEVLRGRLAADTLTSQLIEAYRENDSLALLSVPRVTVREMSVTLRFAVTDLKTPAAAPAVNEKDIEDWQKLLQDRVMPTVFESRLNELPPEQRDDVRDRLVAEPPTVNKEQLQAALMGQPENLVKSSVDDVVNRFRDIPTSLRRPLGTITEVNTEVQREIQTELDRFIEIRETLRLADLAHRSRLQIEVNTDQLQARPAQTVQEVTLVLSMEDVETALAEPQPGRGGGG